MQRSSRQHDDLNGLHRSESGPLEERIKPQRIKTPGWSVNQCPACTEWWKQNAANIEEKAEK
jgi:hypothetical protein